jgi:hypothetical protein
MKLEEMELALARIDVMIGFLKKRMNDGTNCHVAEDIARYQQWRDDLDVQISLERSGEGPTCRGRAAGCIRERRRHSASRQTFVAYAELLTTNRAA